MKIKQDPITKLWCREDGAVLIPPTGYKYKQFRWTYGCKRSDDYRVCRYNGRYYYMHVLVCRAFNGSAPEGRPEVDHINRIRDDNRPSNLHWVDHKENMDNTGRVDQAFEKFGVRHCDDLKAYRKAYNKAHREEYKAYNAAYCAEKKAQGLSWKKGPNGKWGWFPRIRA